LRDTGARAVSAIDLPISAPARPTSRRVVAMLFTAIVVMLFTLSGGVLWELGVNYDGITGAVASKIHPATYLALATFGLFAVARRNPAGFVAMFITRYPGALCFLLATGLLGFYIVFDQRRGIATVFDTYLLAVILGVIGSELGSRDLARVEKLLHVLFAANAALVLVEYVIDHRFFPYRFEGQAFEWDKRSTGLFGHPLENAAMIGTYLMVLVAGGGASMPRLLRAPAALLQLAAMVPVGGRTALVVAVAMLTLAMVPRAVRLLSGGRMSLSAAAVVAAAAPLALLAVAAFAAGGFFDLMAERFVDDGGSAQTRLEMFEIFNHLSVRDILVGAQSELIDSIRRTHGLEWGVENPVVRLLLYQGVVFSAFLVVGFVLFLIELGRRMRSGAAMPFAFFLIVINSFESISNKTVMLGQFVVLMLAMFGRGSDQAPRLSSLRKPSEARLSGTN
jgi:hypothetical protein